MKKILFVTDSCADLPYNFLGDNIKVVPIRYGYKGERGDYRDYRYHGKVANTRRDTHLIESMGVSYVEALNIFNYATDNNMDVICLYSSGKMDPKNMKAFETAAEDFKSSNPDLRITCMDSGNISQGLGLLFTKITELYEDHRCYDEIVCYIAQNLNKYRFDIETDDLDYFDDKEKMGFIDRFILHSAGSGASLLTVKGGRVAVAKKCNDLAKRRDILIERFVNDADLTEPAMVVYNDEYPFEAEALVDRLRKSTYRGNIDLIEASRVSGSKIRPYSLGLAYKTK